MDARILAGLDTPTLTNLLVQISQEQQRRLGNHSASSTAGDSVIGSDWLEPPQLNPPQYAVKCVFCVSNCVRLEPGHKHHKMSRSSGVALTIFDVVFQRHLHALQFQKFCIFRGKLVSGGLSLTNRKFPTLFHISSAAVVCI